MHHLDYFRNLDRHSNNLRAVEDLVDNTCLVVVDHSMGLAEEDLGASRSLAHLWVRSNLSVRQDPGREPFGS